MKSAIVMLTALVVAPSVDAAAPTDAAAPMDAGSGADGRCTVASDCLVTSAACVDMWCTMDTTVELFPDVPGLSEIALSDPAQLGAISAMPDLDWVPPVGVDLIAAAILPEVPQYDSSGTRIVNLVHASWVWDSALPGGSTSGTGVHYSEGRGIVATSTPGNETLTDLTPPPLTPGVYYWAVWGWAGTRLTYRSVVRTFVVGTENISGTPCEACRGVAALRCNSDDVGSFCIIACASNVDCYQGMSCDLSHLDPVHPWGICRLPGPVATSCGPDGGNYDPDLMLCIDDNGVAACEGCSHGGGVNGVLPFAAVLLWTMRRRSQRRR